jgi:hypothetical protein
MKTTSSNILMKATPKSANENAEIIRNLSREMAGNFIDLSCAIAEVCSLKQYKELGYSRLSDFLESQGVELSRSQADNLRRIGNALAYGIDATRDEMVRCGMACMAEIARLAASPKMAREHAVLIAKIVTRKGNGTMTVTQARELVDRALKGDAKSSAPTTESAPESTPEAEETEGPESTPAASWREDWTRRFHGVMKAAKNEADFIALMKEVLEG